MARLECGHTASNDGDVGTLVKGQRKTNRLEKKKTLIKNLNIIVEMNNVQDLKQKKKHVGGENICTITHTA